MSISSRIWEMNNHLLADYEVLTLAGADLTNVDKNIVNLKPTWKERLLYFMNNGTDIVWNNWNKVTGSGTTLSLNNTEEAPMSLTYKGNTSQSGTPTPTSPIPVQVVSGDNSIEVVGKNLFNTTFTQLTNTLRASVSNVVAGTYTFSYQDTNNALQLTAFKVVNGNRTQITYKYNVKLLTFTLDENATVEIEIYRTGIQVSDVSNCQLEKGNQATTYEKYKSASYPISLGDIELCKIGTYQDKIFKNTPNTTDYDSNLEDNVWYLKKEIGKVVLNGTESGFVQFHQNSFKYPLVNGYSATQSIVNDIYCNYLTSQKQIDIYNNTQIGIGILGGTVNAMYMYFGDEINTLAKLQTLLSTNNLVVYYLLTTPTYETITDTTLLSQLEAMKQSYDSQTNISQTNNDMPFELSVTALEVMS